MEGHIILFGLGRRDLIGNGLSHNIVWYGRVRHVANWQGLAHKFIWLGWICTIVFRVAGG